MVIVIKKPNEIEKMKEAGRVAALALREVGMQVKAGVSTLELDEIAERVIRENGGVPTFKGYDGFKYSICTSVNDEIVHGIPSADVILKDGDIISVDVGATVDKWVGDNAWTYPVGKITPTQKRLLSVTEDSMWAGIEAARLGNTIGDIGYAIQTVVGKAHFSVVREFVGHGVGRAMHEDPMVPNFGRRHSGLLLEEGMVLAIEPMVNVGTHKTKEMPDGWTVRTRDGKPSAHFEKTVAITADGPVVLTQEPEYRRPVIVKKHHTYKP